MTKDEFLQKYPLQLNNVIISTLIYHGSIDLLKDLEAPSIKHLRRVAEFAGFKYGAVRTSLSRMINRNELIQFTDEKGIKRYKQTHMQLDIGNIVGSWQHREDGFILAVFNFKKDETKKRDAVRTLLKNYGFKKIAQNTYINGCFSTTGIKKEIELTGAKDNVLLFKVTDTEIDDFKNKLTSIFKIDERQKILEEFYADLQDFIVPSEDILERLIYSGPVFYNICFVDEPQLPRSYLPDNYPLIKIMEFLGSLPDGIIRGARDKYIKIDKEG